MAEGINGAGPLPGLGKEPLNPASEACVKLLQALIGDAMAGKITTIGVVACGPGGFGTSMAGPEAPNLYLGAGALQQAILASVLNPQNRSRIIQPGRR